MALVPIETDKYRGDDAWSGAWMQSGTKPRAEVGVERTEPGIASLERCLGWSQHGAMPGPEPGVELGVKSEGELRTDLAVEVGRGMG